jgi:serine protease Do
VQPLAAPSEPPVISPPAVAQAALPLPGQSLPANVPSPITAVNPLLAMLGGGVLACCLVMLGMLIGGKGLSGAGFAGRGEQERIVNAVSKVAPAVMNIDTEFSNENGDSQFLPTPGMENQPRAGKGTGVIIDKQQALMLTNSHVVSDPDSGVAAKKIIVTTRDGQKFNGKVLGRDRRNDIAVVKLTKSPPAEAKLASMKSATDLQIGQWAIALGNPFGNANTITVGVVSALGRTIPVPSNNRFSGEGKAELTDMIQTDAAINPGNSGGPLCNINGEVIGINTAIFGIGTGLGFSIPITKAKSLADEIIKKGRVEYAFVGVYEETITDGLKNEFGLPDKIGVMVKGIHPGSSAAKAQIVEGDVIRKFDGQNIKNADDWEKKLAAKKPGDSVKLEVSHEGSNKTLTLKVEQKPDNVE